MLCWLEFLWAVNPWKKENPMRQWGRSVMLISPSYGSVTRPVGPWGPILAQFTPLSVPRSGLWQARTVPTSSNYRVLCALITHGHVVSLQADNRNEDECFKLDSPAAFRTPVSNFKMSCKCGRLANIWDRPPPSLTTDYHLSLWAVTVGWSLLPSRRHVVSSTLPHWPIVLTSRFSFTSDHD